MTRTDLFCSATSLGRDKLQAQKEQASSLQPIY